MVSADTPLGLRINCVAWMSRAALQIAGRTPDRVVDSDSAVLLEDASGIPAANENRVVRRPAKMAALTRRVVYFRNKFAAVADLFFRPVLQFLTTTLAKFSVKAVQSAPPLKTPPALIVDLTTAVVETEHGSVATAPLPPMTGLDAMLPAQALLGLAAFVQCCANSSDERTYASAALQVASAYREATELSLRRAALGAMLAAVRSSSRRNDGTNIHRNNGHGTVADGVLGSLTSLSAAAQADYEEDSEGGVGLSLLGYEERESVMAAASWAMDSLAGDSDAICRTVKRELIGCVANLI